MLKKDKNLMAVFITIETMGLAMDRVFDNNCHLIKPLSVSGGFEHWNVVTEEVNNVKSLLSDLSEIGELKVKRIGEYEQKGSNYGMTALQKSALELAVELGYYRWPRQVILEELAKVAKVSRKVYQEHLRKAEAKLVPKVLKGSIGDS